MKTTLNLIKKSLLLVFITMLSFHCSFAQAQSFQDSPSGSQGDFPPNWDLVRGSAEIATLNGEAIIYMTNKSIISPKIDSINYLEDTFTFEFDAFYDEASRIPIHQYYEVRFWDGHSYLSLTNGQGFLNPTILYCHGAKIDGRLNGNKVKYDGYLESMKDAKNVWRHITINYNSGSLKVKIDDFQSINIPNLGFKPKMISIGAYTVNLGDDLVRAIKNVSITGINLTNNNDSVLTTDDKQNSDNAITDDSSSNNTTTTSNSECNCTGLVAIDEGNGIGWRLKGKDPKESGNIGLNAVEFTGHGNNGIYTDVGATGNYSFTSGYETMASGYSSTAFGAGTVASGYLSTASGRHTEASGNYSTAFGSDTSARSRSSFVIGENNIGLGSKDQWIKHDPIFEIGIGTYDNKKNALTVLKNGTITAPSFEVTQITDSKALITKEYADLHYGNTGNTTSSSTTTSVNTYTLPTYDGSANQILKTNGKGKVVWSDNLANTSGSDIIGSGLEAIDEGNGIGWRLKGFNPEGFGPVGKNAVDISSSVRLSTIQGAIGDYAFSSGQNSSASGYASSALGRGSTASGDYSSSFGRASVASGVGSTSMGYLTLAEAYYSTAIGVFNLGGGNAIDWNSTDPLFEVGNGNSENNRSNALTILKNGTITAPSFDLTEITDSKALITKEYADLHYGSTVNTTSDELSSGLEAIDEGNGIGWRLKGRDPNNYGNIGLGALDFNFTPSHYATRETGALGEYSVSFGKNTQASGNISTAMGKGSVASAVASTAMGGGKATGYLSTAMGNSTASGDVSTAMGWGAKATGEYSISMGRFTEANAFMSIAIGAYNIGGGNSTSWLNSSPLFEIGNGLHDSPHNALTVLKIGYIGIGTHRPKAKLHITEGTDASLTGGGSLIVGETIKENIVIDANEIMARRNSASSTLYLQHNGGSVEVGGSIVHSSDRRLKKDIKPLNYGLNEILQLEPKSYHWKNRKQNHKSFGLIAQDVQPIIKELVSKNDKDDMLSINYTELIPILINAIQEQQATIEDLQNKNNHYKASIDDQEHKYSKLTKRIEQLEQIMNQ